ncbi:hypothetical protein JOB18_004464 [Solea senegalensis]|nr:hypothetical protein JOB18_004464 [Solea senegalensis]
MPFHHSSPVHVNRSQFDINVAQLFKKCGNNSSLTEVMCQPFNVSEPRDKCDFLQYYIDGLKSLHHSISSMASIRNLIIQLGHFKSNTCLNCAEICNPNAGVVLCLHKSSMSPLDLHTQLEELGKRINTCQ